MTSPFRKIRSVKWRYCAISTAIFAIPGEFWGRFLLIHSPRNPYLAIVRPIHPGRPPIAAIGKSGVKMMDAVDVTRKQPEWAPNQIDM